MRALFLLCGLAAVVALALLVERLCFRRRRRAAEATIERGLAASVAASHAALSIALEAQPAPPLVRDVLAATPTAPDTTRPDTWQGIGAGPSVREQTAPQVYAAAPTHSNPAPTGVQMRGRISSRALVALDCKACGADLMPQLAEALVSGCPCSRRPALRRVS
jgi:hypothetical protein